MCNAFSTQNYEITYLVVLFVAANLQIYYLARQKTDFYHIIMMPNRIFHARIAWHQYFLLAVLTVNAVGALWCKIVVPGLLLMLLMIVVVEQIVHTTYTVRADNVLEVSTGRFVRKKLIPIADISSMQRCSSMRLGKRAVTEYLLIRYGKGKFVSLMPVKEQEFIDLINKRRGEMRKEQESSPQT